MALKVSVSKKGLPGKEQLFYGTGSAEKKIDMDKLIREIIEMGTVDEPDVYAVITALKNLVKKKLIEGQSIELFKMGTFYPRIKSEGSPTKKGFSRKHIKDISLGFRVNQKFKRSLHEMEIEIV